MRNTTLEQQVLMCLENYGVDEPEAVLRAEISCQNPKVTTAELNETLRHLESCEAIVRNTTILGDTTFSIMSRGKTARQGC